MSACPHCGAMPRPWMHTAPGRVIVHRSTCPTIDPYRPIRGSNTVEVAS